MIALGVLPWVERPGWCLREMARVTRPGGHVIASVNNRRQLNRVLDPRLNPLVEPAKRALRRTRGDRGGDPKNPRHDSWRQYEGWLQAAGLQAVRKASLGFGRFSLGARPLLSETTSVRMNERLQARADAGFPGLRSAGGQLLVLSRKRR